MTRLALKDVQNALERIDGPFITALRNTTTAVELYQPEGVDLQGVHDHDELYIVVSGTGTFVEGGKQYEFEPGDVLFVAAGVQHRFTSFSEDFQTWVIFFL